MQATLALIGFALGLMAWRSTGATAFVAAALLMVANWPWTLLAIMPVNKVLMATALSDADAATRELLGRWNRLHAVRTCLGAGAVVAFLIAPSA